MPRYLSLNEYLRRRFGCKLYKLALDGGFTCPNRDGTIDTRGCIFCSGAGSGDFAAATEGGVTAAIEAAMMRIAAKQRQPGGGYIAYFQSFTGTYAPVERLRRLFGEAIAHERVRVLSVATRPDCLGDDVVALLAEFNQIKPVWVELGLQTVHPASADYIRRGYPLEVFDRALADLNALGIHTIVHLILGLPGETREDMLESVRYVGRSGAGGVKLQLLHVLEGTDLAEDWRAGKFSCMGLDEYASLVADCIESLPPETVIHRFTGDGPKRILLAPLWSGDKKRVLNTVNAVLRERGII